MSNNINTNHAGITNNPCHFPNIPTLITTTTSTTPRVGDQDLKSPEVIQVKRKELHERAFTTFCLSNWDESQIDSLAELARNTDVEFKPSRMLYVANETDSYDKNTSFIRRVFLEGSPEGQFKEIETEANPYYDDGSLMSHPLVNSALSSIYTLLPDEMRPGEDRIEVSLIRQCASSMPELDFHADIRRQVFLLLLACNFKESDGAEMSIKDCNRVLSEEDIARHKEEGTPLPVIEDVSYHYSNMSSAKGNTYLARESTSLPDFCIWHRRAAYSTQVINPERITLRILIDSKNKPRREAK